MIQLCDKLARKYAAHFLVNAKTRATFVFDKKNGKGEKIVVELTKVENDMNNKKSMFKVWKKEGWTKEELKSFWSIDVQASDKEGHYRIAYNPQTKKEEKTGRNILNFDFVKEATNENAFLIFDEIVKRAFA